MSTRSIRTAAAVLALVPLLTTSSAFAGFAASAVGSRVESSNGHLMVRIPAGTSGGITHELTSSDGYIKFRVNIRHADGAFPLIGHNSDEFSPNYGTIKIGAGIGSDASEIDTGTENLDWTDQSKVTVRLQAKTCQLCAWDSYVLTWQ